MQSSFWSNWFKPSKASSSSRKWTLEELGELYEVLLHNGVVTEQNRAVVVETIRTIAEYILWGDQNEPRIFDFFLENNILTYLHRILLQPSSRSGEVAKQVLQTLSIIIQNVRSETGIFFLFSNNHINNIVDLDFDFSDEEVLGYYISFLKTISLKLNSGTVHFFLNASATGRGFPLYSRAIRLAHNREGMVRAAVRTLTLNVYSVPDPDIIAYVTSPPACQYFADLAQYLAEQVQLLDRHLVASECGGAQALGSLDSQLAETEDVLSYVSDLLSLGVPGISQLLADSLWQWVVRPLLLRPLMQAGAQQQAAGVAAPAAPAAAGVAPGHLRRNSGGRGLAAGTPVGSPKPSGHWSWGSGSWGADAGGQPGAARVRPVCAVFVLERLFLLVSYQPLLQQLLLALTCGSAAQPPAAASSNSSSSRSSTQHPLEAGSSQSGTDAGAGSSNSCRAALLGMLSSGQPLPALLVLRLLVAVVHSKHLQPELLAGLSLLPRSCLEQAGRRGSSGAGGSSLFELLQQLVQKLQQAGAAGAAEQASSLQADLLLLLTEQYLPKQQDGAAAAAAGVAGSSECSSDAGDGSSRTAEHLQLLDSLTAQQQLSDNSSAFAGFGQQLLGCLMPLLQLPGLPPLGLWLLGWLLHQLLPASAVTAAAAVGGNASPAAVGSRHRDSQRLGGTADDNLVGGSTSSRGLSRADSSSSDDASQGERHPRDSSSSGRFAVHLQQQLQRGSSAGVEAETEPADGFEQSAAGPPLSTTRAISVQSSLNLEPRASLLSAEQQQLLQGALDAAHAGFAQQLGSMWCEAVFPLLAVEWPAAREMMVQPVLRTSSNDLLSGCGVWPVLRALQQQQQQQGRGQQQGRALQHQGSWAEGHSTSAQAALECYLAVQRVVALTQMNELLRVGCVASTPPVPTVSESDLKQVDIQEGYQVDLAPGSALPCVVSFAPGQERRVCFAVAGLSRQQLAVLQGPPAPSASTGGASQALQTPRPDDSSPCTHSPSSRSLGGAAGAVSTGGAASAGGSGHASLLRSLPVAVLADPAPSRPQAGVVLSVAPLLGARPYTDPQVGKWLHVHVRPSVRGLLRIIKTATAKKGGLLSAMRQLADGHWVLAFSSADKAALAVTLVQQHATRLQGLYGDVLAPMCGAQQQQQQQQQEKQEQQQEHEDLQQEGLQGPAWPDEPRQRQQQVRESLDPAPPEAGQPDGGGGTAAAAAAAASVGGRTAVRDVAEDVDHLSLTGSEAKGQLS